MTELPSCVVLGGGGHAQVLIECLRLSHAGVPVAILDPDPALKAQRILDVPVRGDDSLLPALWQEGVRFFVVGVGGVGDNTRRRAVFERGLGAGFEPLTVIHPSAVCSPSAQISKGAAILARAVVGTEAWIGTNVIVNTGAVVEHHCRVEDHVHVASQACLTSTVTVEEEAHIGAGAIVRQGLSVGRRAIVGAGAVVINSVRPDACVVGVPAKGLNRNSGA